jgi:Flp pilus assembly protein TadG
MHCTSLVHAVFHPLAAQLILSAFVTVQERNSLGAVKAVTAAQLAMASNSVYRVSLDQAIEAMRLTASDMSVKYKETSLSVRQPLLWISIRPLTPPSLVY